MTEARGTLLKEGHVRTVGFGERGTLASQVRIGWGQGKGGGLLDHRGGWQRDAPCQGLACDQLRQEADTLRVFESHPNASPARDPRGSALAAPPPHAEQRFALTVSHTCQSVLPAPCTFALLCPLTL